MPDLVNIDWNGWTRAVLNGDELRVRPEIFSVMQGILNGDGDPTYLARQALGRAGLTEDEIFCRAGRETIIVVDYDLPILSPQEGE